MCFPALAHAVRIRVANVPVRNRRTAGVQTSPKLSVMVDYAERGKAVTSPCARHGRPNRKAGWWRDGMEKLEEAKAPM
jgi:hypothetical protein